MTNQVIPIEGIDTVGVIKDTPSIALPPNAFSDARNVRFDDGAVRKIQGHAAIFSNSSRDYDIKSVQYWPNPNGEYYLIVGRKDNADRVYLVTLNSDGTATDSDISDTDYSSEGDWEFTVFNGGYSVVVNNGVDDPRYISDISRDAGTDFTGTLARLPNWESYDVDSDTVASVRAGILIALGNILLAGDLTEYDTDGNVIRDLGGVVRSSDVAVPGQIPQNWNPFTTGAGTADELLLADTGVVKAMKQLQGNVYVYTADSIHRIQVTNQGLRSDPITDQYGAISQESVFEFDGKHLVIGSNDIYLFGGNPGNIQSVADKRMRKYFYDNLNPTNQTVFIERNLQFDEIWINFATLTSITGEANEAIIWNYRDNTWTIRDLPDSRSSTSGPIPGGGAPVLTYDLTGGPSGDEGQLNNGRKETQTMTIDGTIRARHTGVAQKQTLAIPAADEAFTNGVYEASGNEVIHLVVTGDASPHTEAANYIVSLPVGFSFTYGSEILNGGALITITDNNGTYNIPANALSGLSGSVSRSEYVTAIVNYINNDSVTGFDWSAEDLNGIFRLTSDVVGVRAISGSTLTTYTGSSVSISGSQNSSDDSNGIKLSRNTNITNVTPETASSLSYTVGSNGGAFSGDITNRSNRIDLAVGEAIDISIPWSFSSGYSGTQYTNVGFGSNPLSSIVFAYRYLAIGYEVTAGNASEFTFGHTGTNIVNSVDLSTITNGTAWNINSGNFPNRTASYHSGSAINDSGTFTIKGVATQPTTIYFFAGVSGNDSSYNVRSAGSTSGWTFGTAAQSITSYNWTIANNRSESAYPLQSNLSNVIVNPTGASQENLGTIAAGSSKTTSTPIYTNNNTATYSASVNGTTSQAYNQNTSGVTTTIGSTVFTRTSSVANSQTVSLSGSGSTRTITVPGSGTRYVDFTVRVLDSASGSNSNWTNIGDGEYVTSTTIPSVNAASTFAGINGCDVEGTLKYSWNSNGSLQAGNASYNYNGTTGSISGNSNGGVRTRSQAFSFTGDTSVPITLSAGSWDTGRTAFAPQGSVSGSQTVENTIRITGFVTGNITMSSVAGDSVTLVNANHNSSSTLYSYAARKTNTAVNTVTHANGVLSPSVSLTTSNQTLVTNTNLSQINVQGSYTVVNATSIPQTNPSVTLGNGGVGVYGISAEESPAISLRLTHDDTNDDYDFTAEVLFNTDDNTAEEFRDHLFDSWENDTEFMGVDPTNPDNTQPAGAVFYMTKETYNGNASLRLEHVRGGNISTTVEGFTEFGGTEYGETAFGGEIMENANVSVEGQGGNTPAVIRLYHPASGEIKTILGGTQTDTEVAQHLATTLQNNAAFSTVTRNGLQLTATRAIAVEGDSDVIETSVDQDADGLLNDSNWALTGVQTVRAESAEPRGPQIVLNIGTGGTPTSLAGFDRMIYLETDGDTDTTLSATQIANIIKQQTFDGWTLDLDTDTDTVTFATESNHSVYRNDNGMGTGDSDDSRIWNWDIVSNDGYQPENNEISDTGTAVVTTDGINIQYAQQTVVKVSYSDLDTEYYSFGGSTDDVSDVEPIEDIYSGDGDRTTKTSLEILEGLKSGIDSKGEGKIETSISASTLTTGPTQFGDSALFVSDISIIRDGSNSPEADDLTPAIQSGSAVSFTVDKGVPDPFDDYRPWGKGVFNDSRNYIVMNDDDNIYAMDVGYAFNGQPYASYIERQRMHMQPTKDVEYLSGFYLDAEGDSDLNLYLDIEVTNIPNKFPTLTSDSDAKYNFDATKDYKVDVRETGRMVSYRIGNTSNDEWLVSGISFDVGKKGTR